MQDLINELVAGYTKGRFEQKYLEDKIKELLEFVVLRISVLLKRVKEKEISIIWGNIKQKEEIKKLFRKSLKIADRPIVIYVASKFINNSSVGPKIIKEALKWQ